MRTTSLVVMLLVCSASADAHAMIADPLGGGPAGVVVNVGQYVVELAVEGASAFRLSFTPKNKIPAQIDCPMIAMKTGYAKQTTTKDSISTSFGTLALDASTGSLSLADAAGKTLFKQAINIQKATYPGGHALPAISVTLGASVGAKFYGAGAGHHVGFELNKTSSTAYVSNTELMTSRFWSTDGYAALGVSAIPSTDPVGGSNKYGAAWAVAKGGGSVTYTIQGETADIYLMPAADAFAGIKTHWDLTGPAVVPPKYAFGFMACRWGWQSADYIEEMLTAFRTGGNTTGGGFPIDAFISDFEWYTPEPDYALPSAGTDSFKDFDFDRKGDCKEQTDGEGGEGGEGGSRGGCQHATFPNPEAQLLHYHKDLHFKFGGIRKPRLGNKGNLTMARSKGWTIGGTHAGGAAGGTRNLNYSNPDVREWYQQNMQWYFTINGGDAAVDFWWNDEGETDYFTFHYWNAAEIVARDATVPKKRFFTINRSFSPGSQRLGAVVWTGDIGVSFQELANQGGYLTNWVMSGIPYITCDTGGFAGPNDPPDLLARWYQLAVHLPIMRVHSTHSDTPHFPFLYGQAAGDSMRASLHKRYQLVVYHYSNAHAMYVDSRPMMRPMLMDFPEDEAASTITTQWMDGDSLLAAPIVTSSDGKTTDNSRSVYFPGSCTWYGWNSTVTYAGGQTATVTMDLQSSPLFVKAGSIVPLAPVTQYTDQLPGGALDVVVYAGADATYAMVEDDGASTDYKTGNIRTIAFTWSDKTKTLAWKVSGSFAGDANSFTSLHLTVFTTKGMATSATKAIGTSGSIVSGAIGAAQF